MDTKTIIDNLKTFHENHQFQLGRMGPVPKKQKWVMHDFIPHDFENIKQCVREIQILFEQPRHIPGCIGSHKAKEHIQRFRKMCKDLYKITHTFQYINMGSLILAFYICGYKIHYQHGTCLIRTALKNTDKLF